MHAYKAEIRENIKKRGGGLFGSDSKTGSIGNVTINLARLGYLYKGDEQGLLNRLDELMDLAKESLEAKRKFILEMMERGLYPYTSRYIHSLDTFFSTIGINGANEMIRNFTNDRQNIVEEYGEVMAMTLLTNIRERMEMYKTTTGNLWNLEASPGEAACHKFAREDAKRFPDIIQAGTPKNNYYTNSTQLPVSYTNDPFAALEKQDDLQCMYTGGTVLHMYMGEAVSSGDACKSFVKKILTNFRLPYISITPTFSVCPTHGYISGKHEYCPYCDEEIIKEEKHNSCCDHGEA